jgi:Ni/Co efflux regulator RcnB
MFATAGQVIASLGVSTAASARDHQGDRGRHHQVSRDDHRNWGHDRRDYRGDRFARHDNGRHNGWRNGRGHNRCHTEWRHHRAIRVCR